MWDDDSDKEWQTLCAKALGVDDTEEAVAMAILGKKEMGIDK